MAPESIPPAWRRNVGLFDFLFGGKTASPADQASDRVWLTTQAKLNGIRRQLAEPEDPPPMAVLLVAHFPDTLKQLDAIVAENSAPCPVVTALAENLSRISGGMSLTPEATIDIIVAERHPNVRVDRDLMQFADQLACPCRVTYNISLEDSLFRLLVGDWVEGILQKLGMEEDEAIEHTMLTRRIQQAQDKFAARITGNAPANTAQEWLEKNTTSE